MSKKHFIALADSLRMELRGSINDTAFERVLSVLCDFCRAQNGLFDRERFVAYVRGECGPSGGKVRQLAHAS